MIPSSREEQKKEAFRLFEDGRYQESLRACTHILETGRDPDIEVLAATNSYYTGKYEDAEVSFRDLAREDAGLFPTSTVTWQKCWKREEMRGQLASMQLPSGWTRPTRMPCEVMPGIS